MLTAPEYQNFLRCLQVPMRNVSDRGVTWQGHR